MTFPLSLGTGLFPFLNPQPLEKKKGTDLMADPL